MSVTHIGAHLTAERQSARKRDTRRPARLPSAAPHGRKVKPLPVINAPSPLRIIVNSELPAADASAMTHSTGPDSTRASSLASSVVVWLLLTHSTPATATTVVTSGNAALTAICSARRLRG